MNRAQQVACALALDALIGDPRWFPHPVRLMGRLCASTEAVCRERIPDGRLAGVVAAAWVVMCSGLVAGVGLRMAGWVSAGAKDVVSIGLLWTCFAARDLADHALAVSRALRQEDLEGARELVGRMVGRDTQALDEGGVVRAVVESVAENTVDGVTSPLCFAFLGGPVAAVVFKAVSTLDSMFGYRDERYRDFGWASARLDDIANYLPARLTVPALALAAGLMGLAPRDVLFACLRDGGRHPSPNSGIAEAAVAGALRVQLGGPVCRGGRSVPAKRIGHSYQPLRVKHITDAVALMSITTGVFASGLALGWGALRAVRHSASRRGGR